MAETLLEKALKEIDKSNHQDPSQEIKDGVSYGKEFLYSKLLTSWILKLNPNASEELQIAARGQHISRWMIPRSTYEMTRGGYLQWREDLKKFHAKEVGEILQKVGYDQDFIEKVRSIILKKQIKSDPDTQTLEDGLCLIFLETQFQDFCQKTDKEKLKKIVQKTWAKMSQQGHEMALALPFSDQEKKVITDALNFG